jgi:hypothetical protein
MTAKYATRQQPLLGSGQRANGLAAKSVFFASVPMVAHSTMDTTMRTGVFYAVIIEEL